MVQKKITVEGYTKVDGTKIPTHVKTVEVADPNDKITADRIADSIKEMREADALDEKIRKYQEELEQTGWNEIPSSLQDFVRDRIAPGYEEYRNEAHYMLTCNGLDRTDVKIDGWDAERRTIEVNDVSVSVGKIEIDYLDDGAASLVLKIQDNESYDPAADARFPTHLDGNNGFFPNSPIFEEGNEEMLREYITVLAEKGLEEAVTHELDVSEETYRRMLADRENIVEAMTEYLEGLDYYKGYLTLEEAQTLAPFDAKSGGYLTELIELQKVTMDNVASQWQSSVDYLESEQNFVDLWEHDKEFIMEHPSFERQIRDIVSSKS